MDENIMTIGDFLEFYFPGRDIAAETKRFEAGVDQLQPVLNRVFARACEAVERLEDMPPSPGYEPLLVKRGQHLVVARFFSYVGIGLGKKMADEARTQRTVAEAIRFLAQPGHTKRAISRRAAVLLESKLVGNFDGVDVSVFEFVESLEAVVRGDYTACQRVREMAAVLAPHLSVRRGRKVSAASSAHEMLLSLTSESYTWDDLIGDFSDPQTHATRLAFGDPDFDPRPAHRRRKERLRLKSS
jgi:hypothetical protein